MSGAVVDRNDLQDLALRLAAFTDLLEQRADRVADITEANAHAVESAAVTLVEHGRTLAAGAIAALREETRSVLAQAADTGLRPGCDALSAAARQASDATQALQAGARNLQASQRRVLSLSLAALVIASAIAAVGSGWMMWRSQQEMQRADLTQAVVQATRSGTIVMCGDRVCVHVGNKPRRADAEGYVVAE